MIVLEILGVWALLGVFTIIGLNVIKRAVQRRGVR